MTPAPVSPQTLQRIQRLRLMDDAFMCACFQEHPECAQAALRIIMDMPDLCVRDVHTQRTLSSLTGHAVRLDISATDAHGRLYDIEIQRRDAPELARRAGYYLAMLRAGSLQKSQSYDALPDACVIFICEHDPFQRSLPIYRFEQRMASADLALGDGGHIIFVNTEQQGSSSALGRLAHDFLCTDPQHMLIPELRQAASDLKTTAKGQHTMGSVIDEIREEAITEGEAKGREEGRLENSRDIARQMLHMEGFTPEVIANITRLGLDEVQRLAAEMH